MFEYLQAILNRFTNPRVIEELQHTRPGDNASLGPSVVMLTPKNQLDNSFSGMVAAAAQSNANASVTSSGKASKKKGKSVLLKFG
jgi:hypothetical protein